MIGAATCAIPKYLLCSARGLSSDFASLTVVYTTVILPLTAGTVAVALAADTR